MKITVLGGAGLMGRITVRDLLESSEVSAVTVGELNCGAARAVLGTPKDRKLKIAEIDVTRDKELVALIKGCDVVINSTQYTFNLGVMSACLKAGVHYLDLGGLFHMTRRQLEMHEDFKKRNLIAVLGCGSTPGITNIMAAQACKDLQKVESVEVKIGCADFSSGGGPLSPPYTMETILDEFSLNPMIFNKGKFQEVAPLTGEVEVNFPEPVGSIVACYTLHSEVATFPLSFKDRGIKCASFRIAFPRDFYDKLKFLVALGFASPGNRSLGGVKLSPRKVLLSLINETAVPGGEPDDCDVIRVEVKGKHNGRNVERWMESVVRPHSRWKVSAGALDTGVPASIIAQMIAGGKVKARGVLPPETCVEPDHFFRELAKREMHVYCVTKEALS